MRPTGVLGDVAADGAGFLAAGVGRVEEAVGRGRFRELDVGQPGLDDGDAVHGVDLEDAPHTRGGDDDAAPPWHGAAAQPRAGAAWRDRHAEVVAERG